YGAIGLRVNLFKKERHFTVLQGEVGAMLEAQLPRPSYFGGGFGLNFSVLGGLLRGNCRFKFSLGEKCEMVESGLADGMEVIADMRPAEAAADVDVFTVPQAAFNLSVEKELDAVFDGEETHLRFKLDEFGLNAAGTTAGRTEWDEDNRLARWVPQEALSPHTDYTFTAKIRAQEKSGGQWQDLKMIQDEVYTEYRQHRFTTGNAPDSIPMHNIVQMYPVPGQHYMYAGESGRGWVKLGMGQRYLFDGADYQKRVYFIDDSGDTLRAAFTYNTADRQLNFHLPNLKPSRHYTMQFVLVAPEGQAAPAGGLTTADSEQRDGDNVLVQSQTVLTGDAVQAQGDKLILKAEFATSRYATLAEKLRALSFRQVYRVPYIQVLDGRYQPSPAVHYLQAEMQAVEGFDDIELHGNALSGGPMIEARALLAQEPYYRKQIYPLVYENYPYDGWVSFERNPEHPEIEPDWAVYVSSYYQDGRTDLFPWMYYLPYHYHFDYESVLAGVAASRRSCLRALTTDYSDWLNRPFPPIQAGIYPMRFSYRLPDGGKGSEAEVSMKNEIQ
ncbi:MAG: hypothetical protein K2H62_00215, partial [Bacteroidales bacterium]|nr:hypothetical protein [Bacteroidales bacterium]